MHVYFDLNNFYARLTAYGIDPSGIRVRSCTSTRTREVIPNVFILHRERTSR